MTMVEYSGFLIEPGTFVYRAPVRFSVLRPESNGAVLIHEGIVKARFKTEKGQRMQQSQPAKLTSTVCRGRPPDGRGIRSAARGEHCRLYRQPVSRSEELSHPRS